MLSPRSAFRALALLLVAVPVRGAAAAPLRTEPMLHAGFAPHLHMRGRRPSAPGTVGYGLTFELGIELPFGQDVARVVLVSPGSVTHGHDPNQRFVQLTFVEHEPGGTATAPGERSLAPPGWYMLFVVSSAGVPSKARWIWLG